MSYADSLLETIVNASEGSRKEGFTTGGVSFSLNQANDTITGNFTIPVRITTNESGQLVVAAQDFLEPLPSTEPIIAA